MVQLSSFVPLALAYTVSSAAILAPRATSSNSTSIPSVAKALYDGTCFYPTADKFFELSEYTGRWYQVAATDVPFTAGCTCVYAEYNLNAAGNVDVLNVCQRNETRIDIRGEASAVAEQYGENGVFQVSFSSVPSSDPCPGPNYIVQEYNDDWAIVQAANFTTLFVLSREQNVPEATLDTYIERAGELGSDLSKVSKTKQTGCRFV